MYSRKDPKVNNTALHVQTKFFVSTPPKAQFHLNQSVTFVKILIQMNVRISIHIENCTNIRIYSNIRLGFTL